MSTQSGKRIHSALDDDTGTAEADIVVKGEKRTRYKRLKKNEGQLDVNVSKTKKVGNYVRYPSDDDQDGKIDANDVTEDKPTRKLTRNTLKDHNVNVFDTENLNISVNTKKTSRVTRRTRKFQENLEDVPQITDSKRTSQENVTIAKVKGKKNKKNVSKNNTTNENENIAEETVTTKKSKKKKKKGKISNTSNENINTKNILNQNNISTDSFHSAAGSPVNGAVEISPKLLKQKLSCSNNIPKNIPIKNTTCESKTKKTRKSSIKVITLEKQESAVTTNISKEVNASFDKIIDSSEAVASPRKSETRRSLRFNNSKTEDSSVLNKTFEKDSSKNSSKLSPLDITFNKSDTKLNSTFDKNEPKISSEKSSLISSDATINVTFDKDSSRISITSDDSRTENIINSTPVLIESSIDESHLSATKLSIETLDASNDNDLKVSPTSEEAIKPPNTPLKREGTFTKECPEATSKVSIEKTPTKHMSLPSPGYTPFHTSRSSQRETSMLNVTRSIEKPKCRSSLVDVAPRQTRVMFCSPMSNTAAALQQKKKVIKSSMKGSNKSFVYEDSAPSRPAARKRSFTQSDVDDTRAKRKRLGDELQRSVDRLSRPRTLSATVAPKVPEQTTPAKKQATPSKVKSDTKRTKLPNFAALHQKQFDKMESLDECQERKAKRARQLLTPTGGVVVLERSSPRGITEPAKIKEVKKVDTPTKAPKLPTLESLRPGYTRFGFKMNTEFNPFSIPSKTDEKNKPKTEKFKVKPNGLTSKVNVPPKTPNSVLPKSQKPLQRQPTLPSLKGATSRREAAKQAVMREKSFTSISSKRDVKRSESRTVIKGVRTNRRFELQMKMRNID